VRIDVRQGSAHKIDLKKGTKVGVTIFSQIGFAAPQDLDLTSLHFGRTGTEDSLIRRGNPGKFDTSVVDGDGRLDLIVYVDAGSTGLRAGDMQAVLTGNLLGGTPIYGSDFVETIKPGK